MPLADDEWLLVALPEYLTLPGADFEASASLGTALERSVPDALEQLLASLPTSPDPEPCWGTLAGWSERRCREAFSALECPLDSQGQRALCARLPQLGETRDGRIEMDP